MRDDGTTSHQDEWGQRVSFDLASEAAFRAALVLPADFLGGEGEPRSDVRLVDAIDESSWDAMVVWGRRRFPETNPR